MSLARKSIGRLALAAILLATAIPGSAQLAIRLTTAATPGSAQPGASVFVTAVGFPSGSTLNASNVTVTLTPASGVSGPTLTTTATSVVVVSTLRRVYFTVPSSLVFGSPTSYVTSISGTSSAGTFASTNSTLTINPPPALASVTPATAAQGQTLQLSIAGSYTHFGSTTTLNLGPGITVNSISVTSSTSLVAQVSVASTAATGAHAVTVTTGSETDALTSGLSVNPISTIAPTAVPGGPYTGAANSSIAFNGSGTSPVNDALSFSWNFGDGSATANVAQITHTYTKPGNYTASLTVTDTTNSGVPSNTQITQVTVSAQTPVSNPGGPYQASLNQPVQFDGTQSSDPGGYTLAYAWNFGDNATAAGVKPSHTYAIAGTYTVTLTVSDFYGGTATQATQVVVSSPPIQVNAGGPYQSDVSIPVSFTGSATGGSGPLVYSWNFGDNTTGLGAATSHSYSSPGSYQATLTATDGGSHSSSATVTVTVVNLPTVNVGGPYSGAPNSVVQFNASASGGTGALTYAWSFGDNSTASGAQPSHTYTVTGNLSASLTVTDTIGGSTTVPFSVNIARANTTPPVVTISSPVPLTLFNASSNGLTNVSGTVQSATDPYSALTVSVNGVAGTIQSDGTFTAANVPLREGPTTLTATATDSSGNVGAASISVTLDTAPPSLTIGSPSNNAVLFTSSVNVTGNVNDAVSGLISAAQVDVQVNGVEATVSNGTFSVNDLPLTPGLNTISVVGTDAAGNKSTAQIQVTVKPASGSKHLIIEGGNNESAAINSSIADPLLVQLVDAGGAAIANSPVTFTVTRGDGVLNPQQQNTQTITVNTDANGQASAIYQLGTRVGIALNQVTVTADGAAGELMFSETSTVGAPVVVNVVSGDQQNGPTGQQLVSPFVVVALDAGGNPVPGTPIIFTVTQGGGSIVPQTTPTATGASTVTVTTDANGNAGILLTVGVQEGSANNVVTATFTGSATSPATFSASGMQPGDPSQTQVSGLVLDNADAPISGATISIVGTTLSTTSDDQGKFSIGNAPVGTISLLVNGATANSQGKTYPQLNFQLTTVSGQNNTIGTPIYLPVIDIDSSQVVGGDNDVVLQMTGVPGYQFKIFANSATFPDGSHTGRMSLSQVHVDKLPMVPPDGSAPSIAGTLQPPGVIFNPPVQVQLPNTAGLAPGAVVTLYTYDHDLEQFISQGPAHVSADGSVIVSDPGFGITKSGWHFAPPPPPPHTCTVSCPTNDPCNSYTQVDCACKATPTPDGTQCGAPQDDLSSCQLPGQCIEGICLGQNKPSGSACDDGLFCTKNKQCLADLCKGDPIPDTSTTLQYQFGGLNAVFAGVKKFLGTFGASQYMPDIEAAVSDQQTQHCCEAQKNTVTNDSIQGQLTVNPVQIPDIPVPGLSFEIPTPPGVPDVKAGVFFQAGLGIVGSYTKTVRPCDDPPLCNSVSFGVQLTAGIIAQVAITEPPPLNTGCGPTGKDACNLVKVFLQGQTGLNFSATADCQSLTVGVDWAGVTFNGGILFFEGTFAQFQETFSYQPSWGQPQPISKAVFTPPPF